MIVTRTETLNGRTFIVTTSDSGYMIERDGCKYSEAWDLKGSGRTYTETDERIEEAFLSGTEERQKPLTSSWGEQMTYIEQARKLRPLIEQAAASLDDQTTSEGAALFRA